MNMWTRIVRLIPADKFLTPRFLPAGSNWDLYYCEIADCFPFS
jgi:hypothetical protein